MPRPRAREAGFTLLEVLIALAVLGLVMVGLTQGTRYGFSAWATQARLVDRDEGLDATERTLRQLLSHAGQSGHFIGRADHLDFTTDLPDVAALASRRVDALIEVDDHRHLVLRWKPYRHEIALGKPEAVAESVLLDDVASVSFSYRGEHDDKGAPDEWRSAWSGVAASNLVRVHIEFPKSDPRHWPDIVIARATDEKG
jgi:general secretion pathway protein J